MASDYEQVKRLVDAKMRIKVLVNEARQRAEQPGGSWSDIERPKAVAALKQAMQTEGEELVILALFEGFADLIFLQRDLSEYRTRNMRECKERGRRAEEVSEAFHQAALRKIANR